MIIPLVCLNGVVPAVMTFAALAGEIAAQEAGAGLSQRPVLLLDLVGYAEHLPNDYGVEAELAAVDRAREAVAGERIHLLGYSAGASVALAYGARHPNRVATLTLIEPPWLGQPDPSPFQARMDEIMFATPAEQRWAPFHRLLTHPDVAAPPPPPDPPPWAPLRVARGEQIWRALRTETIEPASLRSFGRPVYLPVAAQSHPWFTAAAHRLARLFPRASIEVYPGNHVRPPHVGEPARFAAALRHLWASVGDPDSRLP